MLWQQNRHGLWRLNLGGFGRNPLAQLRFFLLRKIDFRHGIFWTGGTEAEVEEGGRAWVDATSPESDLTFGFVLPASSLWFSNLMSAWSLTVFLLHDGKWRFNALENKMEIKFYTHGMKLNWSINETKR